MVALTILEGAGLILFGAVVLLLAVRALSHRHREARYGSLVSVDVAPGAAAVLRSERYRISGRPDELRRLADGRLVPIEFKSRVSPRNGVPRSHRIQVAAYCLLVEETTGRSPPYGVVRYGDGGEARIPWNAAAREELLDLRREVDRRYDGRATPSVARCTHCPWRESCDARAA
ncbi:MAG: PD-(D/E)XK nuclease family protein [Thermoplasmata archaeon]|nr:PD-(D/E)XK nuclease family protein [Thermoplasmata archaeon]